MTVKDLLDCLHAFPPDTVVFTSGCHASDCKGLNPADSVSACEVDLSLNEQDERVKVAGVAIGRNDSAEYEYRLAQAVKLGRHTLWLLLSGALAHVGAL